MKSRLISLLLCLSFEASSFPSNARLGYGNCAACHHSPTGGGVLTDYGAGTAESFSTFPGNASEITKKYPIFMGGDFRFLYVNKENREVAFPMQADVELGVQNGGLTTVGQVGVYGETKRVASYRGYIMYRYRNHSLRLGHFAPAFGINEPDHYLPGRNLMGFDSRSASTNLEYFYAARRFSINLTAIGGRQGALYDPELPPAKGKPGANLQLSVFPFKGLWASLSGSLLLKEDGIDNPKGAVSIIAGLPDLYGKLEYGGEWDIENQKLLSQGFFEATSVSFKGVHSGFTFKFKDGGYSYGSQLIWYAFSGLELMFSIEREITEFDDEGKFLGVTHFYF